MSKNQLCRNCGHEVDENYCPACGQRTSTHRLNLAALLESVASTFVGDESYGLRGINMRMGLLRTWYAILRHPYTSIVEFIEGRRRKYFNPVAILLLLSTVYSIVFYLVGKQYTPQAAEGQHFLIWCVNSYYDYAALHPAVNMLMILPFFALAMKTVIRRKSDLKYIEYLYIGIFISIFEITLMILMLAVELTVPWFKSFWVVTMPMFIYTAVIFYKLFGLKKRGAALRTLLVDMLQYVYSFVAMLLITIITVTTYATVAPEKFKQGIGVRDSTDTVKKNGFWLRDVIEGAIDGFAEEEEEEPAPEPTRKPAAEVRK